MATKREVMLAGTPAKLAHMLASDNPNVLAPAGSGQVDAALVSTNFQVLYGGSGAGVRLRPASGQFLHFLFNANFTVVAVYPDGDEYINDLPPGEPFLLEALMSGVFAPARRQWIAGQLSGSGATGAGPTVIDGPFGVGTTPPTDAQQGLIFANNSFVVVPGVNAPGGDTLGHILYNAYPTTAVPGPVFHYLTNGPAYDINFDTNQAGANGPAMMFRYAPPGTAGAVISWQRITSYQPGVIMIDPVDPFGTGGDDVGHMLFNGLFNASQNAYTYFANGPAGDFVYDATSGRFAFRCAPPGTAGQPISFTGVAWFEATPAATGQTNFHLLTNESGTITLQQVMIGPAGSGPGGSGRALYVPT